jgi:2-methylisocitrate lyase-like PEP mutase family enzyme
MKSFKTFSQLHHQGEPLLLGNIWDVNSAKLFEQKGFKAIGTSSAALANTFGYEDGEKLPFACLIGLAKRVVETANIPFTVDFEGGYSRTASGIAENIEKLHDVGVAGVNFEDTIPGSLQGLQDKVAFQKILSAVSEYIRKRNLGIFLNIRTDGFLLKMPLALEETLTRIQAYENSGANGIFVPCITASNDIKQVVSATSLPINVMCMPGLPGFEELKSLGVKRISMGPFLNSYINKKTEQAVDLILADNNFSSLFN